MKLLIKNLFISTDGLSGYFYDPSNALSSFWFNVGIRSTFIPYLSWQSTGVYAKFDNILISESVKDNTHGIQYHSGSYTVYGNPGIYNGQSTDSDARNASDHLPVYATFDFNDNAAPVELETFTGKFIGNETELEWNTATEVNNYGFEIQRSEDKISWSKIGFVAGNGNSNSPKNYSFKDNATPSGRIYYRLKQEDNDGKFEYSNVIELDNKISPEIELSQNFPNPFNPTTTIEYRVPAESKVTLKIIDVLGREVNTLVDGEVGAGVHRVPFDASKLSSGIYIYQLITNGKLYTKKMMLLK